MLLLFVKNSRNFFIGLFQVFFVLFAFFASFFVSESRVRANPRYRSNGRVQNNSSQGQSPTTPVVIFKFGAVSPCALLYKYAKLFQSTP